MNKKSLSILIYSLDSGGAERVVSILLSELGKHYNITLFLMNKTLFYDVPKNVNIVFLEQSNPSEKGIVKLFKLPLLAWKYKKINRSDISLSFMNRPNYINVLAKLFGMKSRTIISERAMPSLQHKSGLQGFINRFLIKHLYRLSDLVIANSLGNSYDLKESFNIKNVITISNPIDIDKINSLSKVNIKLKNDKFTIITIGRLDSGKNHKLLINAIRDIDVYLYIIGEGVLKLELEKLIKDIGVENKVFLLGRIANPYAYLSKSDCFIFTSNYEGFPNVLLEALACALPVISTDCLSGPREILSSSNHIDKQLTNGIELVEYGILSSVNDVNALAKAINLMKEDDILRKQYSEKSAIRIKEFDTSIIIDRFISAIESKNV